MALLLRRASLRDPLPDLYEFRDPSDREELADRFENEPLDSCDSDRPVSRDVIDGALATENELDPALDSM